VTESEVLALNGKFVFAPDLLVPEQRVTFGGGQTVFHVTAIASNPKVTLRSQESPPHVFEVDKADVVSLVGASTRVERDQDRKHEQLLVESSLRITRHEHSSPFVISRPPRGWSR
jgi:hypothetical protein